MITLGIETSCDETSIALVKDGKKVLANVVATSLREHKPFGGVVPEIAHRAHLETLLPCLDEALKKSKTDIRKVDVIAVTQGPGLMGSLLVGLSAAKALALSLNKPLVGVDHVIAHIYAGILSEPGIKMPLLGLVVSGGHTLLLRMDSAKNVQVLGRTLDDAAGEAFDKVAKILGLGYPGGPEIDRLSQDQDPSQFNFTRPYLSKDSLDFSFSGIKTAVYYEAEKLKKKTGLSSRTKKAICAGFQEAVCDVLVAKTLAAAKREGLKRVVVGGGVSANTRLRTKLKAAAAKEKLAVVFPAMMLCQDNAAMIAGLGSALFKEGKKDDLKLSAYADFSRGQYRQKSG